MHFDHINTTVTNPLVMDQLMQLALYKNHDMARHADCHSLAATSIDSLPSHARTGVAVGFRSVGGVAPGSW